MPKGGQERISGYPAQRLPFITLAPGTNSPHGRRHLKKRFFRHFLTRQRLSPRSGRLVPGWVRYRRKAANGGCLPGVPAQPAPRRPLDPQIERDAPQGDAQIPSRLRVGPGTGLGERGEYVPRHGRTNAHRRDARRLRAEEKLLRGVREKDPPGEGSDRRGVLRGRYLRGARPLRPAGHAEIPLPEAPLGGRRGGDDGGGGRKGGVESRPVPGREGPRGAGRNRRIAFREVRAHRRGRGLAVRGEALPRTVLRADPGGRRRNPASVPRRGGAPFPDPEGRRKKAAARQGGAAGERNAHLRRSPPAGTGALPVYGERPDPPGKPAAPVGHGSDPPDDGGAVPPAHARDRTGEPSPPEAVPRLRPPDRPPAALPPGFPGGVPIRPGGSRRRLRGVFAGLLPPWRKRAPAGGRDRALHLEERRACVPLPPARGGGGLRRPGDRLHPGTGARDARLRGAGSPRGRVPAGCEPVRALDGPLRGELRQPGAAARTPPSKSIGNRTVSTGCIPP